MNSIFYTLSNHLKAARLQPRRLFAALLIVVLYVNLATAAPQQKHRPRHTAPATQKQPTATRPTGASDDEPEDPALVAERNRLAAENAVAQASRERELLARRLTAQTPVDKLWADYRRIFPFHSQAICLSQSASDGSRTLIISEPPPHVTLGQILLTVGEHLLNYQVKKHTIGYDGWVKDVALAIRGDEQEVSALLSLLNRQLFYTSYKSYVLPLPATVRPQRYELDLKVTADEIEHWLVAEKGRLVPVLGGEAVSLADLAARQSSGVYFTLARGLVGWWIPRGRSLSEYKAQARQFSLDTDLIVGALANAAGILVLGRERAVPVDLLPPLRVETLILLADVQQGQAGELKQSYERNHTFAGRIEGGRDWAPILLSPELRDTEYGSLLNVTDQLLKGWSNNGETQYINFAYPPPTRWAFPAALPNALNAAELTYNWNTKGAGYTVSFGNHSVLALNRSGALPVSYIPEGMAAKPTRAVTAAEDTAYDFFAGQSDANLVRVVQYAALYQIFSAFDIARSRTPLPADPYPDRLLKSLTDRLAAELRETPPAQLSAMSRELAPFFYDRKKLLADVAEQRARNLEELKTQIAEALSKAGYRRGTQQYDEVFARELAKNQARVDEHYVKEQERIEQQAADRVAGYLQVAARGAPAVAERDVEIRRQILSAYAGYRELPRVYAEEVGRRAEGWLHTPVVVISWNADRLAVGGHNLDAKVTKVIASEAAPVGQPRVDRLGNVIVNPRDVARVNSLIRPAGRNDRAAPSELEAILRNSLAHAAPAAPRSRAEALNISAPPPGKPPIGRPPISAGDAGGPHDGFGWGGGERPAGPLLIADDFRARKQETPNLIEFKRRGGIFEVRHSEYGPGLATLTYEDGVDALLSVIRERPKEAGPITVGLDGIPEQKGAALIDLLQTLADAEGYNHEIIGLMSGEPRLTNDQGSESGEILVTELESLPSGESQRTVSLGGLSARLTFKSLISRTGIEAITQRVARAFQGLLRQFRGQYQSRRFQVQMARAIRKIEKRTGAVFNFRVKYQDGKGDVYIGRLNEKRKNTLSIAGASKAA
jgi:hypothetical protein